MERIESKIVQVNPNFENDKIEEMSKFGWNLQSRQEIVGHLEESKGSDTLMGAILQGAVDGATNTKRYEYDHYVKLHFVRGYDLPNLEKIKNLENEYNSLPYPNLPKIWVQLLFVIISIIMLISGQGTGVGYVLVVFGIWLFFKLKKRINSSEVRQNSIKRASEIKDELLNLIGN